MDGPVCLVHAVRDDFSDIGSKCFFRHIPFRDDCIVIGRVSRDFLFRCRLPLFPFHGQRLFQIKISLSFLLGLDGHLADLSGGRMPESGSGGKRKVGEAPCGRK